MTESTRGILNPGVVGRKFQLARFEAAPELRPFVEQYWAVEWDLPDGETHLQETLPFPSVHLTVEKGASGVFGVVRRRFSVLLAGRGSVLGVKFRPAGFYPFFKRPVSSIAERRVAIGEVFGEEGAAMEAAALATPESAERAAIVERFLLARLPRVDTEASEISGIVDRIAGDREIRKVADLVERVGIARRSLQRSFSRYVGVSPKWVIQRYRLQEAADRAASEVGVNWVELALDLGYYDQAHFIRDFKAVIGRSPGEYARAAAQGR